MAAIAGADVVLVFLGSYEVAALFEVLADELSCLVAVHSGVSRVILDDFRVVGEDVDDRKVVAKPNLKVVGVVGGGNFYDAGTEFHIDVLVGNDGNLAPDQRKGESFADELGVALVLRVYRDGSIAEEGLGTGCGKLKPAGAVGERIAKVPEMSRLVLVLNLRVGNGGLTLGAPVDYSLAAVDKTFFIEFAENLADGGGAAVVKGEAFSLPVAGATELFELFDYGSAVVILPVPGSFEETVATHVLFGEPLGAHIFNDFYLGGDGRMVGSGHPKSFVALHTLHSDEHVLNGFVKGVSHMKLTGDVGRRNNDCKRFFIGIYLGVEVTAVQPELVDSALHLRGVIGFVKFSAHLKFPLFINYFFLFRTNKKARPKEISLRRAVILTNPRYHSNCICLAANTA